MDDTPLSALGPLLAQFDHVDLRLLLGATVLEALSPVCRSVAWRNVLGAALPGRRVSPAAVLCAYLAGAAANALAPARAGDAVKAALVRRSLPGARFATILATMAVLSAFDMLIGGSALVGGAATGFFSAAVPRPGVSLLLATAAVIGVALALIAARHRLRSTMAQIRQGGAILRDPGRCARGAVSWLAAAWLSRVAAAYLMLHAFGLPAGASDAVVVVVVTGLATAVPFVPAGTGVQQVMLVYALAQTAPTAAIIGFGAGMQVGVTVLNMSLGLLAVMVTFRTVRLRAAVHAGRGLLVADDP